MTLSAEKATVQIFAEFVVNGVTSGHKGSGAFIDSNTIATATHIITSKGALASKVWVIVNGERIDIDIKSINVKLLDVSVVSDYSTPRDYATLSTGERAVGLGTGAFGIDTGNTFTSGKAHVSGYPSSGSLNPYSEVMGDYQDENEVGTTWVTNVTTSPGLKGGVSGGPVWVDAKDPQKNPLVVGTLVGIMSGGAPDKSKGVAVDTTLETSADLIRWAKLDNALVADEVNAWALAETASRLVPGFRGNFETERADLSKGGIIADKAAATITNDVRAKYDSYAKNADQAWFTWLVDYFGDTVLHEDIPMSVAKSYGDSMYRSADHGWSMFEYGAELLVVGVAPMPT